MYTYIHTGFNAAENTSCADRATYNRNDTFVTHYSAYLLDGVSRPFSPGSSIIQFSGLPQSQVCTTPHKSTVPGIQGMSINWFSAEINRHCASGGKAAIFHVCPMYMQLLYMYVCIMCMPVFINIFHKRPCDTQSASCYIYIIARLGRSWSLQINTNERQHANEAAYNSHTSLQPI